jgi:3-methylfumaryl-CoA hydratase
MTDIDIAYLRGWIGRTAEATDIVTPGLVARFRATLAPHLLVTEAAPPALHWCVCLPDTPMDELGPDGHPQKGGFLPPVPLPRRMWAGGAVMTTGVLRAGDTVLRRSRIEDVTLKTGRSGPLCFVAVRHEYLVNARIVISERHDIVYRGETDLKGSPGAGPASSEQPEADLREAVDATPVLLFRYSALTFNAHRIHYDDPYVREVEGYDGLVVHGPLQATLMLNAAARLAGGTPEHFSYRGVAPLTAGGSFDVCAARDGDAVRIWTESGGTVHMKGEARW